MPYNNLVGRSDSSALIPEVVSNELLDNIPKVSAVMGLARRLRNMSSNQTRMPVVSALATAYFVNGDTSLVDTTEVDWTSKYIDAEEIAAIVPIPKSVLEDIESGGYDAWGEIRPSLEEALGIAFDKAVLYGTNIPATWTTDLGAAGLIAVIAAASQNVSLAAYTDMYEAILGETGAGVSGLFGMIEEDGFMVTGSIAHLSMKRKLRNVRDVGGNPIFNDNPQQAGTYLLDGAPCIFPINGAVSGSYYLISGQWNQLVYAMRRDVTYERSDQAVITDGAGNIVYNLFQQNMVALKVTMRVGVALPNPINRVNETAATRCAFAYMTA